MPDPFFHSLETPYKGIKFRSRIEARWAVFFDSLNIPWYYEPEGYNFNLGTKQVNYLPDFWLPNQKIFIEIKGPQPTAEEQEKALLLAAATRHRVYIFWGGIPTLTPNGQTRHDGQQDSNLPGASVTSAWCYEPSVIRKRVYHATPTRPERVSVKGKYDTFHHWATCPKCGYTNIVPEGKLQLLALACGHKPERLITQNGRATINPLAKAYNKARAERFESR